MADIILEYKNDCFGQALDNTEDIPNILAEADAAIPNVGMKLAFAGCDRGLVLSCATWDGGNFIIEDAVDGLEYETKQFILSLFAGLTPDCNICNDDNDCDLEHPGNSLLLTVCAPDGMMKYSDNGIDVFAGDRIQAILHNMCIS